MSHHQPLRRTRTLPSIATLVVLVLASCRQTVYVATTDNATPPLPERDNERAGQAPHADSLGGPYGQGRSASNLPPRPTPRAPARIDQTMSDAVLVSYLNSLVYEMGRDRTELAILTCKTAQGLPCPANDGVPVFIQPEWGMNLLDPAAIRDEGVIVARIINFDTQGRPEGQIGFPAAKRTWWYVYRENGTLRSRFFTRTHNPTGPAVVFMDTVLNFRQCPGHRPVREPAMAKWRSCKTRFTASSTAEDSPSHRAPWSSVRPVSFAPGLPGTRRMTAVASDTWVKCMANCCGD